MRIAMMWFLDRWVCSLATVLKIFAIQLHFKGMHRHLSSSRYYQYWFLLIEFVCLTIKTRNMVNSMYLMPCPFTGPKMFCADPNFLSQPKNLTAFSASSKTFVPAQKKILLNANHIFVWHKMFVTATICK